MYFRLEKPLFLLFDVCNNDSYVIMAMASAEECTLKAKAITIITGALQELQTSKSVLYVFFPLQRPAGKHKHGIKVLIVPTF